MTQLIPYLLAFLAAVLIIAKAGDAFVDAACGIARSYGVSRAVIGLTLVSFATTVPEFFTSTIASALGDVGIAYGNAVGSVIANTALILAVPVLAVSVSVEKERLQEASVLLGLGAAIILLTLDAELSRHEGFLLLFILALFLKFVIRREAKKGGKSRPEKESALRYKFSIFGISAVGIAIASRMLIYSGVGVAQFFGIPEIVIGLTMVAVGTSIPELATAIISSIKKVPELSLGNIIGANILNLMWVLGTSSAIRPLPVDLGTVWFGNSMMLGIIVLLIAFIRQGRLGRQHGILLLALYAFYLAGFLVLGHVG